MNAELFEELLAGVREAGAHMRGEQTMCNSCTVNVADGLLVEGEPMFTTFGTRQRAVTFRTEDIREIFRSREDSENRTVTVRVKGGREWELSGNAARDALAWQSARRTNPAIGSTLSNFMETEGLMEFLSANHPDTVHARRVSVDAGFAALREAVAEQSGEVPF